MFFFLAHSFFDLIFSLIKIKISIFSYLFISVFVIKPRRVNGDHWGDLGVDGWIILGWIFRRWDVGMWTRLGWPSIGTGGVRL